RRFLAALSPVTGTATSWQPDPDNTPYGIIVDEPRGVVYVSGGFTTVGGQTRPNLAAIDATTGQATAWNPSPDDGVISIASNGSRLYAGGYFTYASGMSRPYVVEYDLSTGLPTAWRPNPDSWVEALALGGGGAAIHLNGYFANVGGVDRPYLARFIPTTTGVPEREPLPGFALASPTPNPSFGVVDIEFQLGRGAPVQLSIFDVQGREVARVVDEVRPV